MLVYNTDDIDTTERTYQKTEHVEFISYTGEWPSLCMGELTLLVDGKEYVFGNYWDVNQTPPVKTGKYATFWSSGGECYFTNNYTNLVQTKGEWQINVNSLPEELRQYAEEIDFIFNHNVMPGCCGGCS